MNIFYFMFIAHGPIAYLANKKLQRNNIKKLDGSSRILVSLLAIFFGILPDFDMFLLVMKHLPTFLHHSLFTHSLTFWILIWLLLKVFFFIVSKQLDDSKKSNTKRTLFSTIETSLLIGTVSHIFIDMISSGVRLFYPLENMFTILGNIVETNLFAGYFYSPYMALEILIIVIFLIYVFRTFLKKNLLVNSILYLLAATSSIYLLFTTYVFFNTYNVSTPQVNGEEVVDADFDTVLDTRDADTDNDFVNNIDDVNYSLLAKDALKIISSNAIVGTESNFLDKIYLRLGAFNSYRLVSQAYTEQNKSIEPVLERYAREKDDIQGYDLDLTYSQTLFAYFKEKNVLTPLNALQSEAIPEGRVFFVTDMNEKVINTGITLEDNYIGIVLSGDKRLHTHSISEVQSIYKGLDLYIEL